MEIFEKVMADLRESGLDDAAEFMAQKTEELALGDDLTAEEANAAIEEIMSQYLGSLLGDSDEDNDDVNVDTLLEKVKGYLNDLGYHHFLVSQMDSEIYVVELEISSGVTHLGIEIYINGKLKSLRLKARLPFDAETTHAAAVCKTLEDINWRLRYGSFLYDKQDGEICYEYSFRIHSRSLESDFKKYFVAVISNASDEDDYPRIRRAALGLMKGEEREKLIAELKAELEELEAD